MGTWNATERGPFYDPGDAELIIEVAVDAGAKLGLARSEVLMDIKWAESPMTWAERLRELESDDGTSDYIAALIDAAENGSITWWNVKKRGDNDEQSYEQHCADVAF